MWRMYLNLIMRQLFLYCFFFNTFFCLASLEYDQKSVQQHDCAYMQQHIAEWAPGRQVAAVEEMKGGLGGSRIYTINFDHGEPYVVRLLVASFAREQEWQNIEIKAMQAAHQAGVGPEIIAAHTKDEDTPIGYVVMQKINITPPEKIPWMNKDTYSLLGSFLKKMHTQSSIVNVDKESIYKRMGNITDRIKTVWQQKKSDGLSHQLSQVITFFEKSRSVWFSKERTNLVHGDLLLGNLLYNGTRFVAVDWEQSRLVADPLFDVALVYDCLVPKKYHHDFMQGYCQQHKLSSPDNDRLKLMRFMAGCFVGLAYACSNPTLFVDQFHKNKEEETNINKALHDLMRDGLKRNTREECATFGSLLFMQGYRWLDEKRLPMITAMLNS